MKKGVLKEYSGNYGQQLDLITESETIKIGCGWGIELFILGKWTPVPIEMDMNNKYYGVIDDFKITNLNGKSARVDL